METTTPAVLGRYRTAGGATVDIAITTPATDRHQTAKATCTGALCDATKTAGCQTWWTTGDRELPQNTSRQIRGQRAAKQAAQQLTEWAQAHAETCHAMPAETSTK